MGEWFALATMESRAWGAYRLPVPEADTFVIGASPRRSDRCAIDVFAMQLDCWI